MNSFEQLLGAYRAEGAAGVLYRVARRVFVSNLIRNPKLTIVQVGAFVGATGNDPLYRLFRRHFDPTLPGFLPDARAILVEPEPRHFATLVANYARFANIIFENVAIGEREGVLPFFSLDRDPRLDGQPEWLEQLGSLREDRMTTLFANIERNPTAQAWYLAHRTTIAVPVIRLGSLLERHQVKSLDLLQVDTEGSDFTVLASMDLRCPRPRFINYERTLLGEDEPKCRVMLRAAGYRLRDWGQDTFCWHT